MRRALAFTILLAGCERAPTVDDTPGGKLEATAIARGLVPDPVAAGLAGLWASDTDRLCVVPAGKSLRLGATVDYGEGQNCAAAGKVEHDKDKLAVTFGECTFAASFDGERIVFPATLPAACEQLCHGRASLTALSVERLSESVSEAATLRAANGQQLCAD